MSHPHQKRRIQIEKKKKLGKKRPHNTKKSSKKLGNKTRPILIQSLKSKEKGEDEDDDVQIDAVTSADFQNKAPRAMAANREGGKKDGYSARLRNYGKRERRVQGTMGINPSNPNKH